VQLGPIFDAEVVIDHDDLNLGAVWQVREHYLE